MPIYGNYLLIASMDVEPDKEDLLNEVYDTEHIPEILKLPGVVSVSRMEKVPLILGIGGEIKEIPTGMAPKFTAIYEIESPEVLKTDGWGKAVEYGRWPGEVRPYTSNRQFTLQKVTS